MMKSHHIVLWGDPGSNQVLAKLFGGETVQSGSTKLPLKWNKNELKMGNASYDSAHHAPVLVYPNPLSPSRYIVINSTFTFRQGSDTTNALQTPKLPDWAVVDLRTPPSKLAPGAVVDAGFFNEQWQLP